MQETQARSLGWEDPLEKEMAVHSSILCLENPMDWGAWQATVPGVAKSWTRLSTFAFTFFPHLGLLSTCLLTWNSPLPHLLLLSLTITNHTTAHQKNLPCSWLGPSKPLPPYWLLLEKSPFQLLSQSLLTLSLHVRVTDTAVPQKTHDKQWEFFSNC